jgi:hypothetical protein
VAETDVTRARPLARAIEGVAALDPVAKAVRGALDPGAGQRRRNRDRRRRHAVLLVRVDGSVIAVATAAGRRPKRASRAAGELSRPLTTEVAAVIAANKARPGWFLSA